jgi:cellulose biosynthesis protein BcsQ
MLQQKRVNALAAADSVIIPVCPKFLDALGLEQLLKAVAQIKRQINPMLAISGILLTMVDRRAKLTREEQILKSDEPRPEPAHLSSRDLNVL